MKWGCRVRRMSITNPKADVGLEQLEADLIALGAEGWEAVSWWHTIHQHMDEHGVGWKIDSLVLLKRAISN
jgi:hypothetical protein